MDLQFVLKECPDLLKVVHKMVETHVSKDHDYAEKEPLGNLRASIDLGIEPWRGVMCRMGDKFHRIESLTAKGVAMVAESIEDAMLDLAIYTLICDILLDPEKPYQTYEQEASRFIELVSMVIGIAENEIRVDGTPMNIPTAWNRLLLELSCNDTAWHVSYEQVSLYLMDLAVSCVLKLSDKSWPTAFLK